MLPILRMWDFWCEGAGCEEGAVVRFATTWLAQPRDIIRRARTVSGLVESRSPFGGVAVGSISPAAAESLLVNEDIAQPAQDAVAEDSAGCGVLILGPPEAAVSGGRALSGMAAAALRIFWM